ncbi:DNA polymerase IV [Cellvibrio polysaccharolyticus]|uniref:DNA polymerase IV n=1 Tax=Cellvibrio polysaccharolyticus TaxID=2082724 RepID=A0A928YUJ4_9GAMM|nr:DNA polymerase IV [Cellvibrio polysaccharolyticus]MBE8717525.1 DNA polymerase IV [Cellvibrio polysaccharolyticus]
MDNHQRKIIHIDCDCFYAAVEMRDNPSLRGRPIAVGGDAGKRGVVATCNYESRAYGIHSAMPSAQAKKLCPQLLIVPPRMAVYREVSAAIQAIFADYTPLIQPLSLDEAYLDVSDSPACKGSATLIAQDIRRRVHQSQGITVSAGVAPNKFLAKIASDWNKPDGLKVILPHEVDAFVAALPVKILHGVGRVTAQRLNNLGIETCADLKTWGKADLVREMGIFGERLWALARGVDDRPVEVERKRQSVSVENTYDHDLPNLDACIEALPALLDELDGRIIRLKGEYHASKPFIKLKFHDFTQTTLEQAGAPMTLEGYRELCIQAFARGGKPVRLIGVGVRLDDAKTKQGEQLSLFSQLG